MINISSSSRVGNQPGGAIALPTGHPGGGIALPAGVRLVVPATAGAFSGNLINISSGLYIINSNYFFIPSNFCSEYYKKEKSLAVLDVFYLSIRCVSI